MGCDAIAEVLQQWGPGEVRLTLMAVAGTPTGVFSFFWAVRHKGWPWPLNRGQR